MRRRRTSSRPARLLGLAATLILAMLLTAAPARASWNVTAAGGSSLYDVSCGSATFCVAAVYDGRFYVSTDGGATWSVRGSILDPDLWDIDCPTATVCYASGQSGEIRKTTDSGATWTTSGSILDPNLEGIACATATFCMAAGTSGEVRRTTDGTTWTSVGDSDPDTEGVACPSTSVCYVANENGTIRKTTDGGANWVTYGSSGDPDLLDIACSSTTECVAVELLGRKRVTSDGSTWSTVGATGDPDLYAASCIDSGPCWVGGTGGSIQSAQPTDLTSWRFDYTPTSATIYGVSCPTLQLCVGVGHGGAVVYTTDAGGGGWIDRTDPAMSTQIAAIGCPTASTCIAAITDGRFQRTTDAGASWTILGSTLDPDLSAMSCPSSTVCLAVSDGGTGAVRKSTDAGATWSTVASVGTPLQGISCPTTSTCYATGGLGTIRKTTDGGSNWTTTGADTDPDQRGMACSSTTHCIAGVQDGRIRRTTDGTTWAYVGSIFDPDIYGNSLACPSSSICYVAGWDGTIRKSTDGGASWAVSGGTGGGDPDLYALACADTTHCLAVGAGGAAQYTSTGSSWERRDWSEIATFYAVTYPSTDQAWGGGSSGEIARYSFPNCGGGSAMLSPFSSLSFGSVSLAGTSTATASGTMLVTDATGLGAGWSVSATSTLFSDGAGHTLPANAVRLTGITTTPAGGYCAAASNTTSYPITLPAGLVPPTAAKIYSTGAGTGMGTFQLGATAQLTVPENAYTGTYTSTWTITVSSGP